MNSNEPNAIAEKQPKSCRVYTKLKFTYSEESGALVGFVSQNPVTGRICGVRQDSDYPKKICIVDRELTKGLLTNVLYDCTLIPMNHKNGYVVVEAAVTQFKARVTSTYIKGCIYLVEVKFGNKVIRFDPHNATKKSVKDKDACKAVILERVDIKDVMQVAEDFERAAKKILKLMECDTFRTFKP